MISASDFCFLWKSLLYLFITFWKIALYVLQCIIDEITDLKSARVTSVHTQGLC